MFPAWHARTYIYYSWNDNGIIEEAPHLSPSRASRIWYSGARLKAATCLMKPSPLYSYQVQVITWCDSCHAERQLSKVAPVSIIFNASSLELEHTNQKLLQSCSHTCTLPLGPRRAPVKDKEYWSGVLKWSTSQVPRTCGHHQEWSHTCHTQFTM